MEPTEYTPMEHLALVVSKIVAQASLVINTVSEGREHPMGVYRNEYGKIIQMGKPQRKALVGMIVMGEDLQALTDAFVAARECPEGLALLAKVQAAGEAMAQAGQA